MKVSTFKSVGAKLFYYMSALVLITVVGNSFQYIRTFRKQQTEQVQKTLVDQAERAANQFQSTIDTWGSQLAVALPTLRSVQSKDANAPLRRFVDSNKEFVGLELLEAKDLRSPDFTSLGEAFTSNTSDARFEDKAPSQVATKIKSLATDWLKHVTPHLDPKTNIIIETIAKQTRLPLMLVAARFDVTGSHEVVWAVLTTWQSNLIKALPKTDSTSSAVLDSKGRVFTSLNQYEMVSRKVFGSAPLARVAQNTNKPSGFVNEYRNNDGHHRLGAFNHVPHYDLTVVVEQNVDVAYQQLQENIVSTSLWASLFILIAVMFSFLGATGITKGLRAVTYATSRIAAGDLKYQIRPSSQDEVGLLGLAVNHMTRKIIDLLRSQVDKARFEKELETAKVVQSTFFPRADIKKGPTVVTGFYEPASECGGDLWGHYTIAEGVEFVFIADAMGHGTPAALVTALAYSTTMTIADIIKSDSAFHDSPAAVLGRLNRIISEAVRGSISMTFFACIIDTRRGVLTYANAGHNFPIVIPAKPDDPRVGKKTKIKGSDLQPITLKLTGTPLGMDPATEYKNQTLELHAGDKIFFFTDGLIECSSPTGEVWGRKFLIEQIMSGSRLHAEALRDDMVKRAFDFFGGKALDDDVTIVVAELDAAWKPQEHPGTSTESEAVGASGQAAAIPVSQRELPELRIASAEATPPLRMAVPAPAPIPVAATATGRVAPLAQPTPATAPEQVPAARRAPPPSIPAHHAAAPDVTLSLDVTETNDQAEGWPEFQVATEAPNGAPSQPVAPARPVATAAPQAAPFVSAPTQETQAVHPHRPAPAARAAGEAPRPRAGKYKIKLPGAS